jgi:hypothetical protein
LKKYCERHSIIRDRCKLSCGQCRGIYYRPSHESNTQPIIPPPSPTLSECKDDPNFKTPFGMPCSEAANLMKYFSQSIQESVKKHCQKSLGSGACKKSACKDDSSFRTAFNWSCAKAAKYLKHLSSSLQDTIKTNCKESTGQCHEAVGIS